MLEGSFTGTKHIKSTIWLTQLEVEIHSGCISESLTYLTCFMQISSRVSDHPHCPDRTQPDKVSATVITPLLEGHRTGLLTAGSYEPLLLSGVSVGLPGEVGLVDDSKVALDLQAKSCGHKNLGLEFVPEVA